MDGSDFRLSSVSLGSQAVESEKRMDNNFCSKCEIANTKQYLLSHQFKGLKKGKGNQQYSTLFINLLSIISRFISLRLGFYILCAYHEFFHVQEKNIFSRWFSFRFH